MNTEIKFQQERSGSWTALGYVNGVWEAASTSKRKSDAKQAVQSELKKILLTLKQ